MGDTVKNGMKIALLMMLLAATPAFAQDTLRGTVNKDTLRPGFTSTTPGCVYLGRTTVAGTTVTTKLEHVGCWDTAASPIIPPPIQPPPTGTLSFNSTWDTQGTSDAALHDNGKWNATLCDWRPRPIVAVVAAPAGMPGNAFQWSYSGGGQGECYMLQQSGRFTAPAVGQAAFYRFYYLNTVTDPAQAHWLQATSIKSWEWKVTAISGGQYSLRLVACAGCAYSDAGNLYIKGLKANAVYRVEFRLWRVTTSWAKAAIRIYDATGALVATSANWVDGAGRAWVAPGPDIPISADADFHTFDMGNNDARPTGSGLMEVGGFAVRVTADTSAWIGK